MYLKDISSFQNCAFSKFIIRYSNNLRYFCVSFRIKFVMENYIEEIGRLRYSAYCIVFLDIFVFGGKDTKGDNGYLLRLALRDVRINRIEQREGEREEGKKEGKKERRKEGKTYKKAKATTNVMCIALSLCIVI